jgi:hypothetical protein
MKLMKSQAAAEGLESDEDDKIPDVTRIFATPNHD